MIKLFAIALALATSTAAAAAPANDSFVGPRVEVTAGISDVRTAKDVRDVTYGARSGLDAPVGDNFTVGAELYTDNVFDRDRVLGVAARVGYAVTPKVLPYVRAGYENYRAIDFTNRGTTLDGFTVGGGFEVAITPHVFTGVEYRYSGFNRNVGRHSVGLRLGLRL